MWQRTWTYDPVSRSSPKALLFAASGQLRNMATIGGNIMQRTRCAYFRDEDDLPCNKRRPGSGCSARYGFNRNHAIFGWSDDCVATNPSDLAVAFARLDANVLVRGPRRTTIDSVHGIPSSARQHARARQRARPWRSHRSDRSTRADRGTRLALLQASRPPVVRVRAGFCGGRRGSPTTGALNRRDSRWAALHTSRGV